MKTPRIITKIGDLFEVPLDGEKKRYFQFVAIDATQLNSSVIGVFKSQYPLEARPTPDEVIRAEVDFYAHPMLKIGILRRYGQR
jgi:hypothetical protein